MLSFAAIFGLAKAFTSLASGWLADRRARRATLLIGWLVALPVPLLILWARSWWWIVAANALLGINQGMCWSTTVIMKIDLVGPRPVSYTHLRAHETGRNLVCRLLLEKKKKTM